MQILDLMDDFEAAGGWSLKEAHIDILCEIYDEHTYVLEYRLRKSGPLHDKLHRKPAGSAAASLSAEPSNSRFWTSDMEWKVNLKNLWRGGNLIQAPWPIQGKGEQKYWLSLQYDHTLHG